MKNWIESPLGELSRPKQWPTLAKTELSASGFPVYGANGPIGFHEEFTHENPTILIGCRGSCGTVHITPPRAYANGNAMALDDLDGSRIDIAFLANFLRWRGFRDVVTGTSQPQIIGENLKRIRVPLPPLPEQRRIAAILDKADALRTKRREALAQLDRLAQSIFVEMFGDPTTNPKGWPVVQLGEHLLDVTNGLTRRGNEVEDGEHIVLRLRDIRAGSIDFSEPNRITLNEKEQAKYRVAPGELLFIRVNGNPEYVGRCSLFDGHPEQVFFNDHVMRVRLKSSLEGGYLAFFLNRPDGKREIAKHRKTSAGQHTINQDGLGAISLPLPPRELQKQFLNRLTALRKSSVSHHVSLAELGALFGSIQHRAFRGEL